MISSDILITTYVVQYSLVIKVLKILKRLKLASVRTVVEIFKLSTTRKLFSSIHYKLQLSLIGLTYNGGKFFQSFIYTHISVLGVCFCLKYLWKFKIQDLYFQIWLLELKIRMKLEKKNHLIVIHLNYFSHGIYNPFLKYSGLY